MNDANDSMPCTGNVQLVGVRADKIVVQMPKHEMTHDEALVHAAWLVALAERKFGEFDRIQLAVNNS